MNKTLHIGLAGYSFIIDENAYEKLSIYIQALRNALDPSEADEVMLDIEYRMVEIFRENLKNREIINEEDVEKVITQIGKPELIEEQEHTERNTPDHALDFDKIKNATRSLFRDTTNQKIAGVCSGMAHWSKMDTSLMRILWLGVFFFGLFVIPPFFLVVLIAYIALWAILPKATTATDFLKMKGEPINFDSLKNESTKLHQIQDTGSPKGIKPHRDDTIWKIIRYTLGGISAMIAFSFLISMIAIFFTDKLTSYNFQFSEMMEYYFDSEYIKEYFTILYVLLSLVPTLIFTMLAIKFFSPKTKVRNIGYLALLLIVASTVIAIISGIEISKTKMFYKGTKHDTQNISIQSQSDSIYIDMKEEFIPKNFKGYLNDGMYFTDKKAVFVEERPRVSVTRNDAIDIPYMILTTKADGYNIPIASKVNVEIKDNKILLPNYIQFPYSERFRNYRVHYELVVPNSKTIIYSHDKIKIHDEKNNANDNDDDAPFSSHIRKDSIPHKSNYRSVQKMNINGNRIEIERNSAFGDSIKINGKLYDEDTAERMIEAFENQNNR